MNNNKIKSKENIHKKEVGPYRGFGYSSLISDPLMNSLNIEKRLIGFNKKTSLIKMYIIII